MSLWSTGMCPNEHLAPTWNDSALDHETGSVVSLRILRGESLYDSLHSI